MNPSHLSSDLGIINFFCLQNYSFVVIYNDKLTCCANSLRKSAPSSRVQVKRRVGMPPYKYMKNFIAETLHFE